MKNKKRLLITGLLLIALVAMCLFGGCKNKNDEPTTEVPTATETPIEEITLTTSPSKETTKDGGIDNNLPAINSQDDIVILSGYELE